MGFHECEWCKEKSNSDKNQFSPLSSADVTLVFTSGRAWIFPHTGLLHYITTHSYQPPAEFIEDVMTHQLHGGSFLQTKSPGIRIGYLVYPELPIGSVPEGFAQKLAALVEQTRNENFANFRQTRNL